MSEEDKEEKKQYQKNQYHNMSEEDTEKERIPKKWYQNMSEENKQRPSFIFFASHSIKNGAKSLIINVLIKMYLVKTKDQLVLIK